MVRHAQIQRAPAKAGARTSPYFDKKRANAPAILARPAPVRKIGSARPADPEDDAMARLVGAMRLEPALQQARRAAGFFYLDDLAQLEHMCGDADREVGEAAGRAVAFLVDAGASYSELVCAHACGGEGEGADWLADITEPGPRPRQTVEELAARVKALLGKIGGELARIERVFERCLAPDAGAEADAELETELWLEGLAGELAAARFGGAARRAAPKTICAVFNKRDRSYLEVNCPSSYCEDAAVLRPASGRAGLLYGRGAETDRTIRVLQELGARYIADDRKLFMHRNDAAAGGELRSAHIYATEELLFVWLAFA